MGRPPPRRAYKKLARNPKTTAVTAKPLDPFPHRKTGKASCFMHLHRAMSSSFGCSVWRKRQRCKTLIIQLGEFTVLNSPSISTFKTLLQILKTFIFSINMLCKTTCSFWKMRNAVWQQIRSICLVCCWQRTCKSTKKKCSPQTSPIHLWVHIMQQVNCTFTSKVVVHKLYLKPACTSRAKSKNIKTYLNRWYRPTILQQIQSCAQINHL